MGLVELDGRAAIEASVVIPRVGVWHIDLVVDSRSLVAVGASVTVTVGEQTFIGTVSRSGQFRDSLRVRVLAGGGGFATLLQPRAYRDVPFRIPLTDILTGAGETLSSTADATLTGLQLNSWARMRCAATDALARMLEHRTPDDSWRVLPDGTTWVGVETWPASGIEVLTINDQPELERVVVWQEAMTLQPGATLNGRRVSRVEHTAQERNVRTVIYFEVDDGS